MILPFNRTRTEEEIKWELEGGSAGRILYNHFKDYGYYGRTEEMVAEFDRLEREFTAKVVSAIADIIERDYNVDRGFDYTKIADKQKRGILVNGRVIEMK